jgi:hypothetical protein
MLSTAYTQEYFSYCYVLKIRYDYILLLLPRGHHLYKSLRKTISRKMAPSYEAGGIQQ